MSSSIINSQQFQEEVHRIYLTIHPFPSFFFLSPDLITYQPNFAIPKPRIDSVLPSLELYCLTFALKIGHYILSKEMN